MSPTLQQVVCAALITQEVVAGGGFFISVPERNLYVLHVCLLEASSPIPRVPCRSLSPQINLHVRAELFHLIQQLLLDI